MNNEKFYKNTTYQIMYDIISMKTGGASYEIFK